MSAHLLPNSPFPALSMLAAAPHRLLFFVGAGNVLAAMVWWAAFLAGWVDAAVPGLPAPWLHAFIMQYQMLPAFIFGFLLTVFPRWLALPEATRWHYLPVGMGLVSGQVLMLVAAWTGSDLALWVGWLNTFAAWLAGMAVLVGCLQQSRTVDMHARSIFAALCMGLAGLVAFGLWLHFKELHWLERMAKLGALGLLVPVYVTVAHRMFPFFAGNVVPGYVLYRPRFALTVLWVGTLAHLLPVALGYPEFTWPADLLLAWLGAHLLWHWWPRAKAPALLRVLFIGFAWWPIGMVLFALDSATLLCFGSSPLARAPLHAIAIGFFGSLLVAMVTRVTAGHSGRPLVLGRIAALCFVGMQVVALLRILADLQASPSSWWLASAFGWLLVFLPWVLRSAYVYLTPRADGRVG